MVKGNMSNGGFESDTNVQNTQVFSKILKLFFGIVKFLSCSYKSLNI